MVCSGSLEAKYAPLSCYNYCENNPVNNTDSTGNGPDDPPTPHQAVTLQGNPTSALQPDAHDTPSRPHERTTHHSEHPHKKTGNPKNKDHHPTHNPPLKEVVITAKRMDPHEAQLRKIFRENVLKTIMPYIRQGVITQEQAFRVFEAKANKFLNYKANQPSSSTLQEARVRAFLRMIRVGEGTTGEKGYEKLFGGGSFIKRGKDWSTHPDIVIHSGKYSSSAAGAYQIMRYTYKWLHGAELDKHNKATGKYQAFHDYIRKFGIKDFSPESQDLLAIIILKYKDSGALKAITEGHIEKALDITSYEWASLPNSHGEGRYGQPTQTLNQALKNFYNFLDEEMKGTSDLHLPKGFLSTFTGK